MNEQSELGAFVTACAVVLGILSVTGGTILGLAALMEE